MSLLPQYSDLFSVSGAPRFSAEEYAAVSENIVQAFNTVSVVCPTFTNALRNAWLFPTMEALITYAYCTLGDPLCDTQMFEETRDTLRIRAATIEQQEWWAVQLYSSVLRDLANDSKQGIDLSARNSIAVVLYDSLDVYTKSVVDAWRRLSNQIVARWVQCDGQNILLLPMPASKAAHAFVGVLEYYEFIEYRGNAIVVYQEPLCFCNTADACYPSITKIPMTTSCDEAICYAIRPVLP